MHKHNKEIKNEAIKLRLDNKISLTDIALRLNVNRRTVVRWLQSFHTVMKNPEEKHQDSLKEYLKLNKKCLECGKDIPYEKRYNKFCSHGCSAKYNNVRKIKKVRHCRNCGSVVDRFRVLCDNCKMTNAWKLTLGELQSRAKYQCNAQIRNHGRIVFKNNKPNVTKCERCGYDKHIEICHIKDINKFSPDTPIMTINAIENLIGLCPNCHWEFDNIEKKHEQEYLLIKKIA